LLKITADSGAEIVGFADVKDFIGRPFHKVKAGAGGQALYFLPNRHEFVTCLSGHITMLTSL
jgi:hypothetical protein